MTPNQITYTIDLEDHRPDDSWPERYPALTIMLLDWLAERSITGTVFIVGELAARHPDLVREIAERGHEVAFHNWRHETLTSLDPATFREWARRGKAVLEDLAGQEVIGFRAPTGSLVPRSMWCTDVLADEGFTYSSSVIPTRNPLFGFPDAPIPPFFWQSGLAEVGTCLIGTRPFRFPGGGTYLRLLPASALVLSLRRSPPPPSASLYFHPHDFDLDEPRWRVPDAGPLSPLLWIGRRGLLAKLDRLVRELPVGGPMRDRLHEADGAPTVYPSLALGATRLRAERDRLLDPAPSGGR